MLNPSNSLGAVWTVINSSQNQIWKPTGYNLDQIVNIVVERLEAEGVDPGKIPACIESAINIIFCYPILSYQEFNKRMKSRGWLNFKIDEHTFKLVKLISNHTETTPLSDRTILDTSPMV